MAKNYKPLGSVINNYMIGLGYSRTVSKLTAGKISSIIRKEFSAISVHDFVACVKDLLSGDKKITENKVRELFLGIMGIGPTYADILTEVYMLNRRR